MSDFFAEIGQRLAFSSVELAGLSNEFLNEIKNDKAFENYNREIEFIIRNKKHTLSEPQEVLLATVSSFQNNDDIYSNLSDVEMYHGSFVDENGEEQKLTNGNYVSFLKSPSQEIRKKVMKSFLGE